MIEVRADHDGLGREVSAAGKDPDDVFDLGVAGPHVGSPENSQARKLVGMGSVVPVDRRVQFVQVESRGCQPALREFSIDLQNGETRIRGRTSVADSRKPIFVFAGWGDKDQCHSSGLAGFERFVAKIRKATRSLAVKGTVGVGFSRLVAHRQHDLASHVETRVVVVGKRLGDQAVADEHQVALESFGGGNTQRGELGFSPRPSPGTASALAPTQAIVGPRPDPGNGAKLLPIARAEQSIAAGRAQIQR